jgi:D-alanyl-lipoteichoic acid acyltransferase DltB (MBOAT superfamily)
VGASYLFYGWWDYRFCSLLAISTVVDYLCGRGMAGSSSERHRKALLTVSCITNLGILGFFKYFNFFADSFAGFFAAFGLEPHFFELHVILPVGISFYTFQTMSYTIDVYRGSTRPVRDFLDFALYVAFFPQLVAGPIERSGRLMPQIVNPRPRRPEDFTEGLYLVVTGLFKKIVVADNMAVIVNGIFAAEPSRLSGGECLIGVYAFAFQIYGDFSGYSCIARGVARWLGFDLMTNFNMPYFATSPRDFWSRWHISLSTWLRDYLYIPLGGNRKGRWKTYRNLMLTMLLGGLWHGAGWTFIAWGFFHGALLIGHRLCEKRRAQPRPDPRTRLANVAKALLMFHLVCVGWLLFRAQSMPQAWGMAARVFADLRFTPTALYGLGMIAFYVAPLMALELWLHHKKDLLRLPKVNWVPRACVYSYFALMLVAFHPTVPSEFIYFQF